MTPCPICQKPVDPLRAPAMRVREGKVIPYCSKEHADLSDTQTPATPAAKKAADATPPPRSAGTAKVITPAKGIPASMRTPATGVPSGAYSPETGPVIQIVHEPATGVVTSASDARAGKVVTASHSETDGAIQIAETGTVDDYVGGDDDDEARGGRGVWLLLLLLLVIAGGAAAYYLGYLDSLLGKSKAAVSQAPAPAAMPVPAPEHAVTPPVDAGPTASALVDRSRELLGKLVKEGTPRVQIKAAAALARTGDAGAIAALTAALDKETSDMARSDIAYALARGGDKRGTDTLAGQLGSARRDVKLDAANRLARLGDARAAPVLVGYLEVEQLRLGAAESLAYLKDQRAIDALDKIVKDDPAPDHKNRAQIALVIAGREEAIPAVRALLTTTYGTAAAQALARAHDRAGRELLVETLKSPTLRVDAARALRVLEPELDAAPLLQIVAPGLDSKKDLDQVDSAHSVLLLAGPASWSEYE